MSFFRFAHGYLAFLLCIVFFFPFSSSYAASCVIPKTTSKVILSGESCSLGGIATKEIGVSGRKIINGVEGDIEVDAIDLTIPPDTTLVWPEGKGIAVKNGARIIRGSGAILIQRTLSTYLLDVLGFNRENSSQLCCGVT